MASNLTSKVNAEELQNVATEMRRMMPNTCGDWADRIDAALTRPTVPASIEQARGQYTRDEAHVLAGKMFAAAGIWPGIDGMDAAVAILTTLETPVRPRDQYSHADGSRECRPVQDTVVVPTEAMLDAGQHVLSEWLNDNAPIGEGRYRGPAKEAYIAMLAASPATHVPDTETIAALQNERANVLIERIGKVADLASETPLKGPLGDVAYDLLREASAHIASVRLAILALNSGDR